MNRRDILKSFGAIALAGSFPAVLSDFDITCEASEKIKPQFFAPKEFAVLETVVDVMLPRTKTPGGLATQVPVFIVVTDGACMPSSPSQNPSLTYMALTARACDHAVKELRRGNLT